MALTLSGNSGNTTLDSSNGITFSDSSNQQYAASPYVLKNRIINGDMRIDQRNAGASVSVTTSSATYTLDRWDCRGETSQGVYTVQQSSTAPTGFNKSLLVTVTTADSSLGATDNYYLRQAIEGFNIADLGWGAASASTVTLSFWVRSSLTGTFGGSITNGATATRAYGFTYAITAANTWEQKTITIAGDTTGTWNTDNSGAMAINFSLGANADRQTTANVWSANSTASGAIGEGSIIGTNGATLYITGVQLEVGSTATPFERRLYGTELALCQRYLPSCPTTSTVFGSGMVMSTTTGRITVPFSVTTRTAPTGVTVISPTLFGLVSASVGGIAATGVAFEGADVNGAYVLVTVGSASFVANSGVQAYKNSPAQLLFTGCEI